MGSKPGKPFAPPSVGIEAVSGATFFFVMIASGLQVAFGERTSEFYYGIDIACSLVAALYALQGLGTGEEGGLSKSKMLYLAHIPPWGLMLGRLSTASSVLSVLLVLRMTLWGPLVRRLVDQYRGFRLGRSGKIALIAAAVLVVVHWLSSLWLFVRPVDHDPVTAYNLAVYWVVTTLATVGYGDITPATNIQRIYAICVMLLGVGMYGVVIGQITSLVQDSDRRRKNNKERLELLDAFCRHYDVPDHLRDDALGFYEHMLTHQANEDEKAMLEGLPESLRSSLAVYMRLKPLSEVSLFKGCSHECLLAASRALQKTYIVPGEEVITQGQIGTTMYLLGHGIVDVLVNGKHVAALRDGSCFGEIALVLDEPRTATVRAQTHCELFMLNKESFAGLAGAYPELKQNVDTLVSARRAAKK